MSAHGRTWETLAYLAVHAHIPPSEARTLPLGLVEAITDEIRRTYGG